MRKKVIASILTLMLAVQPCSMVSAAEVAFTDGTGQAVEVHPEERTSQLEADFQDGISTVPEETEPFGSNVTLSAGEGDVQEEKVQIGDDVWVTFEGDTATISGTGATWDFYRDGMDFSKEHTNPFANIGDGLKNIIIEDGITRIGDYLFYNEYMDADHYNVENVSIGKDVKSIGKYAFQLNSITSISFPEGLETIGDYCFMYCALETVYLPSSLKSLGISCFDQCNQLTTVNIPEQLEVIPENCFRNTALTSVTIGDNVKKIGLAAFEGCDFEEIILPSKLEIIGGRAFADCSNLKSIEIPESVVEIAGGIFSGCTNLKDVLFNSGNFKIISASTFFDCTSLYTIEIPNGIETIDYWAFSNCLRLQEVVIPSSVTYIDELAFEECDNLRTIKGYTGSEAEQYAKDHDINFVSIGTVTDPEEPTEKIQIGESVYVTFTGNTATISGEGDMWDFYNDGWDFDSLHQNPFIEDRNITQIIIEDGVTSVSDYFLSNYEGRWKIESISLGANISRIGKYAFSDCSNISSVILPDGITGLGEGCFTGCSNLGEINMPDSITEIGSSCFGGCNKLTSVKLSNNLTSIPDSAFSSCMELESITIPDKVKTIGANAFGRCNSLQEIRLPQGLQSIGFGAFNECVSLNEIFIPKTVSLNENAGNIFLECSRLESIVFEEGYTGILPYNTFDGCSNLRDVIIPKGVTAIRSQAFRNCIRLQEITIPASVTQIEDDAFNGCENLNLIKGYTGSEAERFANEHNIPFESLGDMPTPPTPSEKIQVGDNVYATVEGDTLRISGSGATYDYINEYDHWWTDNFNSDKFIITKVVFNGDITYLGNYFLAGFTGIKEVILPEGLEKIGDSTFNNCPSLAEIILPEGLKHLGNDVFVGCSSLKEIVLPEGLTKLGNDAFAGCNALEKIVFPSTLEEIPVLSYDFDWDKNLISLKEVIIPEGVKKIGEHAFRYVESLESISLPNSLIEIDAWAFTNAGLKSLSLPDNIETVGDGAFQNCTNLQSITIPEKCINWGDSVFYAATVESITWNAENPIIPSGIFAGCVNLKNVTIPEGVTAINNSAFADCTSLTNVSIPESVTELGDSVFSGCSSLEKISIPKTVTYFGNDVFYNCRNLTIYGYRDSMAERYANNNSIPFVSADYKVVFKNNGRTVKTEYVLEGNDATPPTLDPREGYTLSWDGDYTDIQEDMVINAVWTKSDDSGDDDPPIIVYPPEETKYTVTFVDRGKVIKTEKVVSGEAADYPYIYRYGYSLEWDKDFSKVTSDMTVNAVWTVITPEKITSLTAEILPKSIRLSWDENEYTNYFLIYRKASNETKYTQVGKTTKVLWTDKTAKNGTEYQYKVAAVRAVSGKKYQSEDSDIVTAKLGGIEKGKIYSAGNLNYKVMNTKEVQVIGLAKLTGTVSIPSTVTIAGNVFKVTSIADKAFMQNTDIINVRIGNNITQIGQQAFYKCANLETVNLGSNVLYLRNGSFARCTSLKSINIPKSVKRIGIRAFYHCSNLSLVAIRTTRLEYIGKKALEISPKTVIKVPEEKYNLYKRKITQTGIYSGTKIDKI